MTLLVLELSLAVVAMLAVAPVPNNEERHMQVIHVGEEEPEVLAVAQVHQPQ